MFPSVKKRKNLSTQPSFYKILVYSNEVIFLIELHDSHQLSLYMHK